MNLIAEPDPSPVTGSFLSLIALFFCPSSVGINDLWKDAFYVTRTTGPSSEGHPAPLVVSKLSLRWAMMEGQVVQLKESTPKIGRGELRRFFSRIKFVDSPYQL